MPRPVRRKAVPKRHKKNWKPIRIRFKPKLGKIRTIALLPYAALITKPGQSATIFIYGELIIRTRQASSTDGMIGGLSTVEYPFHLNLNQPETTVGPRYQGTGVLSGVQVNLRFYILTQDKRLDARWRLSSNDPWSEWLSVVEYP